METVKRLLTVLETCSLTSACHVTVFAVSFAQSVAKPEGVAKTVTAANSGLDGSRMVTSSCTDQAADRLLFCCLSLKHVTEARH